MFAHAAELIRLASSLALFLGGAISSNTMRVYSARVATETRRHYLFARARARERERAHLSVPLCSITR